MTALHFTIGDRIGPPKDDEYRSTGYGVEQMSAMAWMFKDYRQRWMITVGEPDAAKDRP